MYATSPRLALCAAALAVTAAACGAVQAFEVTRVQKSDVQVLPGANGFTNPLTGVVAYAPQDWQHRRALGIKVGNSSPERPQAGLDRADIVYEEIVEGGVTRFLAVFLTNQAPRVGPVRSVRTVDHKILQPLGALFGYSGGVPPVISELRDTPGVTDVGANVSSGAFRRDSARNAPYNLYTTTDELWSGRDGTPPKQQFEFLKSDEDPAVGGEATANDVKLNFSNSSQVHYRFDTETGRFQRFNGDAPHSFEGGDGVPLSFTNVIVQTVDVSAGSTIDTGGERTTDIRMIGGGSAALFRGGKVLRGTWTRGAVGEPTRFIGTNGQVLKLAPGTTIIELLPKGRDIFVT